MSINFQLASKATLLPGQHHLGIGVNSSLQSPVTANIGVDMALDGTALVVLVDSDGERNSTLAYLQNLARAQQYPVDKLPVRVVNAWPYRDDGAIAKVITDSLAARDLDNMVIFRDLAQYGAALTPTDPWLLTGCELAQVFGCPVLTSANYGPHPALRPDFSKHYRSQRVLEIKAKSNLDATIEDLKSGSFWNATGRTIAGALIYDIEPGQKKGLAA